jgi:hypothetical protein
MTYQLAYKLKERLWAEYLALKQISADRSVPLPSKISLFGLSNAGAAMRWIRGNIAAIGTVRSDAKGYYVRVYLKAPIPEPLKDFFGQVLESPNVEVVVSGPLQFLNSLVAVPAPPAAGVGPGPLTIGSMIQIKNGKVQGTLGAFVNGKDGNMMLTCRHVLDVDLAAATQCMLTVEQPTQIPGQSRPVGTLVDEAIFDEHISLTGDWALATVSVPFSPVLPGGLGPLDPVPIAATQDLPVVRASAAAQPKGTVANLNLNVEVDSKFDGTLQFVCQLGVSGTGSDGGGTAFADSGDSGSLVITDDGGPRRAVGLAFAKNVPPPDVESDVELIGVTPLQAVFSQQSLTFIT